MQKSSSRYFVQVQFCSAHCDKMACSLACSRHSWSADEPSRWQNLPSWEGLSALHRSGQLHLSVHAHHCFGDSSDTYALGSSCSTVCCHCGLHLLPYTHRKTGAGIAWNRRPWRMWAVIYRWSVLRDSPLERGKMGLPGLKATQLFRGQPVETQSSFTMQSNANDRE